jgi:SM-20-related protein
MNPDVHFETIKSIGDQLLDKGYAVENLDSFLVDSLNRAFELSLSQNKFHSAGVGRDLHKVVNKSIRSDSISWIEDWSEPHVQDYFKFLCELQKSLSRKCMLVLKRFEGHFALYEEGAFYQKHLDNHRGANHRQISVVLFLNACEGGELQIYDELDSEKLVQSIPTQAGRLVVFDAKRVWHGVNPTKSPRRSLSGWFRDDD